jgi:hypothetical protein
MSIVRIAFAGLLAVVLHGEATADGTNVLQLSRDSGVKLVSQSGNSSGSAFFVADRYVLTCFHVVAALTLQGPRSIGVSIQTYKLSFRQAK